jgi:poly(3-hydroxybutyrate) depolymerase
MGTDGEMFRGQFYGNLLSAMADEAIVVHPNAAGDPTAWDTSTDVDFFDAMLGQLTGMVCIDEGRIFATGHSSGGFFSNSLGCERGDVLRGIAPVSGGGPMTFGGGSCAGQVAAWIAHAPNDDTVDFSSGQGSRDHWAEANGCDINATEPATPAECVSYGGCDTGYPVMWCEYDDGHNWPSFAPQGMWDFFKSL